jgi:hypothetical protein
MQLDLFEAFWNHLVVGACGPVVTVLLGVALAIVFVSLMGRWLSRHRVVWFLLTLVPFRTVLLGGIVYCHWGLAAHYVGLSNHAYGVAGWILYAVLLTIGAFLIAAVVLQLHCYGRTSVTAFEVGRDLFFGVSVLAALNISLSPRGLGAYAYLQFSVGDIEAAHQAVALMLAVFLAIELLTGILQAVVDLCGEPKVDA